MVRRPTPRRQSRGFTLLLALGVVTLVTMAVMLSYSVVGREADSQADTRRQKQAFFAAEAGLAEGRETVRLIMANAKNLGELTIDLRATLGAPVNDIPGLGSAARPYFELLPPGGGEVWNRYELLTSTLEDAELPANVDYPEQRNVRYRVFVRDDDDSDPSPEVDGNQQVWVVSIAEVANPRGRPTRSVVQALVTNVSTQSIVGPGTPSGNANINN
ncbi:hypothetical protein HRD49_16335 [Corallococcus exiguus]|uniref:hypothetical protein n=1 Tax=Corallococcus TaxID=83461 RepID=UPI000EA1E911|nr:MULTISPECIES: hypothetical protein [Corallococcus]NNC19642.1 hypothetical protein [Corallococcus exiguus]NRD52872.1 hypothetical protein [Corallococcus exiguus]NRD63321.1 hypothetical protein [Corallococcus exiguus]RKH31126.1 hypothetical protein D7V77_01205 [Corallococcus sp. CA041A]RKI19534.1 hypothetical protein D7Y15_04300 [Corallococcus sp. AB030]